MAIAKTNLSKQGIKTLLENGQHAPTTFQGENYYKNTLDSQDTDFDDKHDYAFKLARLELGKALLTKDYSVYLQALDLFKQNASSKQFRHYYVQMLIQADLPLLTYSDFFSQMRSKSQEFLNRMPLNEYHFHRYLTSNNGLVALFSREYAEHVGLLRPEAESTGSTIKPNRK